MTVRIIDGVAYLSKSAEWWQVKAHPLGNGHTEVTAKRGTDWIECQWTKDQIADHLQMCADQEEELAEERKEKSLAVAANRAKKRVRQLCKAMGADTLLTLTYRANQQDLQLCKEHLEAFARRMKTLIPGFRAVCGFEQQKRGAWHVHMATVKLPATLPARNGVKVKSFNIIRAVWAKVTKDLGGNIDISSRKRHSQRSAARIASYLSKYITKAFAEGEKWMNRWTKYGKCDVPLPVDLGRFPDAGQALQAAFSVVCGETVDTSHYSHFGDWFYMALERPPGEKLKVLETV